MGQNHGPYLSIGKVMYIHTFSYCGLDVLHVQEQSNQYAVTIAAMEEKLLTLMKKSQLLEKKNESLYQQMALHQQEASNSEKRGTATCTGNNECVHIYGYQYRHLLQYGYLYLTLHFAFMIMDH